MIDIATIDHYISQHGRFCLFDWMLSDNTILYSDYEAWRLGEQLFLADKFLIENTTLTSLMENTSKHCLSLGLVPDPQEFLSWNNELKKPLAVHKNQSYHQQLTQAWLRPQDRPQLDLFMDNSAQSAEKALQQSLAARQFEICQKQLQTLSALNPQCAHLGHYQDLINYGLHILTTPIIDNDKIAEERQGLNDEVAPLAQEALGQFSRDYLSFAWRRLANSLSNHAFNREQPELHASAALLKIPDYQTVIKNLPKDSSLYYQAILLERLCISYAALHQRDKSLMVWCLMMELDADYTEAAIGNHKKSMIYQLWLDFSDENEEWSSKLFPSYILLKNPSILRILKDFPALKHSCTCAIINLLQARLNNESEIKARTQLKMASPEMLKIYLSLSH